MRDKVLSATAAASLVPNGATVAITGSGGGLVEPDAVFEAIERRFIEGEGAAGLTLVHSLGMGDRDQRGTNRFAHDGMVRRVIGGHWTWSPRMQALARDNRLEAYSLPGGVIAHLLREIGAGRPGLITHVGLGTFVDPRFGGGRMNDFAREELVELVSLDGKEYLRYKPFPVNVGIVRGTFADTAGNISLEEEPADLDAFAVALAAHNSGGKVIAQVREVVAAGTLGPRSVVIPGALVDAVVVVPQPTLFSWLRRGELQARQVMSQGMLARYRYSSKDEQVWQFMLDPRENTNIKRLDGKFESVQNSLKLNLNRFKFTLLKEFCD